MKHKYDSKFKSAVALEALRGDSTVNEIAAKYGVHPQLVKSWKSIAIKNLGLLFTTKAEKQEAENRFASQEMLETIGELKMENKILKKAYETYLLSVGKK